MVFYFSGTGNSKWVAEEIAKGISDRAVNICDFLKEGNETYNIETNEKIGFVFPVYAWRTPKIMLDFIPKVKLNDDTFAFAVCTCGDEAGDAIDAVKSLVPLSGAYSIIMPNNYIIMGTDVDTADIVELKLKTAKIDIATIINEINDGKKIFDIDKGTLAFIKTKVIGYLFNKYALSAKPFFAEDSCTACGLCEKICPSGCVKIVDGKPKWGDNCMQCLACINHCPQKAIQYGKKTAKLGRYVFNDIKINE